MLSVGDLLVQGLDEVCPWFGIDCAELRWVVEDSCSGANGKALVRAWSDLSSWRGPRS